MRADELQLDDWVLYDGKPNQVRSLSDDNGCRLSMRLHSVLTYYAKPIPLTPEIMELNGFEYDDRFVGECYTICGTAGRCLVWNNLSKSLSIGPFTLCKCEYVHQLQHILRDCGMGVNITKVEENK